MLKYLYSLCLILISIGAHAQQNIFEQNLGAKRIIKVSVYPTLYQIWNHNYCLSLAYEKPLKLLNAKTSITHIGEYYNYATSISLFSSAGSSAYAYRNRRLTYRADLRYYISKRSTLEGFFVGLAPFIANENLAENEIKRTSLGVGLTLGYQKEIFKRFTLEVNPFFGLGASHYQRTLNNEEISGIDERYFFGLNLNIGRILKPRE